jgi:predicted transcriptional regulator
VDIDEPEQGDTISDSVEIRMTASDGDGNDDIEIVFIKIDDGEWQEATFVEVDEEHSRWIFLWDTTNVKNGEHHIYAKASDGKEDSEMDVVGVFVDNPDREPGFSGILALLLMALIMALLAFLLIGGTEVGKFALFSLFILPLYTKISKKDVLDHFVRGQIFGYLKVHPGDNYTTIKKNLDLNNGTLTYHLNVLEREGMIKSWSNGGHKYFYPKGVKIPGNGVKNPSIYSAILKSIEDSPGISIKDIAAVTGISRQLANYHVRKMAAEGQIELERKSLSKVCYPKQGK